MPKFLVSYTFHGRSTRDIEAGSLEEAKAMIEAEVNKDDFEIDADEIDTVDYDVREMHPVVRDGRKMWTTYPMLGDIAGHPTHMVRGAQFGSHFVKEFDFFVEQGGFKDDWGSRWRPVIATSIEDARSQSERMEWSYD